MKLLKIFFVLLIAISVSPAGVSAQDAAEVKIDQIAVPDNTSIADNRQTILQYEKQVEEQEMTHGAFDPELGEQLFSLGLLYKNTGNNEKAGEVLERALHIKKVNQGIQSMSQVPILNTLIEVNLAARKWDELNRNYHLLLWLHQRNLGFGNPEILPVIEAVGRWKFIAYNNGLLSEKPLTTLRDITEMFESTIEIMEDLYGENDARLIVPLNGLAMARYQMVQYVVNTPISEFQGFGNRSNFRTVCELIRLPDGSVTRVCRTEEIPNPAYYASKQISKDNNVSMHMDSVRNVLMRIIKINEANPTQSHQEHAQALVNLGDWHMINSNRYTAIDKYQQAYQILVDNNAEEKIIDDLFKEPVRIPPLSGFSSKEDNEPGNVTPYVKLAFDVTIEGKAKKIKVIEESDPDNFKARKFAKDFVDSSLFRPKIQDGKPVETQQMEMLLSGVILEKGVSSMTNNFNSARSRIPGSRIRR